jgi:hypothetical protein
MFGLKDISISFLTGQPWLVWPSLVILLGLGFLLYRRTNPPIPGYLRIILGFVRLVAVLVLVAALLEPVVGFSRQFERSRRVSVLLDDSNSMDRVEDGLTRRQRLDSLLSSSAMAGLTKAADVQRYYFGENLSGVRSDVTRGKTALGEALQELDKVELEQPADDWLLLSDGNSNTGLQPEMAARTIGIPIISVGLGGETAGFDVGIDRVDFNPVMFVGRPSEMKVRLSWDRGENQKLRVQLIDSAKVVTENAFTTTEAGGLGEVTLKYTPTEPGQRLLKVSIPALEGELNTANNARTIAVKVMKSRLAVLLVAERPDYEVGFLNRFLQQSERYDVDLIVTGADAGNLKGRFPDRQTELNRYDLIVFYDPDPGKLTPYESLLKSYLSERGGGVWVLMGPQFAARGSVEWFNQLLPFYSTGRARPLYAQVRGVPDEGQLFHPAVRLADDRAAIRDRWASLPPFDFLVPCERLNPDGVVLVWAGGPFAEDGKWPALGTRRLGPGKLMASAVLPFWSWGFETLSYEGSNEPYRRFVDGSIAWLTTQDDFDPIRIAPEKSVFTRGETVRFEGFAFDQGFRPIPEVTGTVSLTETGSGEKYDADLIDRGEGKHVAEFAQLPPGTYSYRAGFEKGGQTLKWNEGRILVESFSLEEYDQRGNDLALRAVSRATGGQYFSYRDFNDAVAAIQTEPVVESVKGEFSLWGRKVNYLI